MYVHKNQIKLIDNFIKNNDEKINEISEAITAGDKVLAHRLVHTLAGNAGQLNKTGLQKAAESIENQLKEDAVPVTAEQMTILETELNDVLAEFVSLTRQVPDKNMTPQVIAKPFDPDVTGKLLDKLESLLQRSDAECLMLLDELRHVSGSAELIILMENFDFESAYDELLRLKEENLKD